MVQQSSRKKRAAGQQGDDVRSPELPFPTLSQPLPSQEPQLPGSHEPMTSGTAFPRSLPWFAWPFPGHTEKVEKGEKSL